MRVMLTRALEIVLMSALFCCSELPLEDMTVVNPATQSHGFHSHLDRFAVNANSSGVNVTKNVGKVAYPKGIKQKKSMELNRHHSLLVMRQSVWYMRSPLGLDKLVLQGDGSKRVHNLVSARGESGKWYAFKLDAVPYNFLVYLLDLPVKIGMKTYSYDGENYYIQTGNGAASKVVKQGRPRLYSMQAMTADGVWTKIPNTNQMSQLRSYLLKLPVANDTILRTENHRLRKLTDGTYVIAVDDQMRNFVGFGDSVIYARSVRRIWYKFKNPPIKFLTYVNRFIAKFYKAFDIENEGV